MVWIVGLPFAYILWYDLFVLCAMAGTAALHTLQRERYGLLGAIASLVTFVGLAIDASMWNFYVPSLGPTTGMEPNYELERQFWIMFSGGMVTVVSLVILGIMTITAKVLPWWSGAALLVGGPFLSWIGRVALGGYFVGCDCLFESPLFVLLAPVPGVAWVLVGLAVFRAAGHRSATT